jgi:hypothetical protein
LRESSQPKAASDDGVTAGQLFQQCEGLARLKQGAVFGRKSSADANSARLLATFQLRISAPVFPRARPIQGEPLTVHVYTPAGRSGQQPARPISDDAPVLADSPAVTGRQSRACSSRGGQERLRDGVSTQIGKTMRLISSGSLVRDAALRGSPGRWASSRFRRRLQGILAARIGPVVRRVQRSVASSGRHRARIFPFADSGRHRKSEDELKGLANILGCTLWLLGFPGQALK